MDEVVVAGAEEGTIELFADAAGINFVTETGGIDDEDTFRNNPSGCILSTSSVIIYFKIKIQYSLILC